jgi:hypothetical protein
VRPSGFVYFVQAFDQPALVHGPNLIQNYLAGLSFEPNLEATMSSLSDPTRKTVVSHDLVIGRLRDGASARRLGPSRLVLCQPTEQPIVPVVR